MYKCANCGRLACFGGDESSAPRSCPMNEEQLSKEIKSEYMHDENNRFFVEAAKIEKQGYGQWNRVRETIELCKRMGYREIGMAFCLGLVNEARTVQRIFEEHGLNVHSVICKTGGNDKCDFGIPSDMKLREGRFEAACNPIGQARFLAEEQVDFIVVIGLCVGHDSLFYKYAAKYTDAFVTTLVSKDRATGNNPCAAIYCADGYFKDKFGDK